MKAKKSNRKLNLNKTTIIDLQIEDLQNIRGGHLTGTTCPSGEHTGCHSFCGSIAPCE